ncbi:MAG TPA: TIGR01212 family radical SAM protein [candidate division Zixibacteria bacterium]|nr:TIGR01212 family radical SAM protein [candidate division Zixibacteria bacterium]
MYFPVALKELWSGKRYNSYNRVLKSTFSARVYKIGLRMDFTCPNRDGTVAVGGCIYCNNAGHTAPAYRPRTSVTEQLEKGAAALRSRHRAERFIAYFQSYTNTYDSAARLERLYREALDFPGVVGLAVATRPDCLPDDVLALLADISRRTYLWLELGLESMHERTLRWVNRGHGLREFVDAVGRAKERGLRVCAHLILGFPTETREEMLQTPALLNRLRLDGVKLHNLHVIENTVLAKLYRAGLFGLFSRDDYVSLVADFLERLDPGIVIHRLTGETYRAITVAPDWSVDKIGVLNAIHEELDRRNTWQGKLFSGGAPAGARGGAEVSELLEANP